MLPLAPWTDPRPVPAHSDRNVSAKVSGMRAYGPSFRTMTAAVALSCSSVSPATPSSQQQTQSQPAQQPPQGSRRQAATTGTTAAGRSAPVFRAGINFVRVDVIITDKNGKQIGDLTEADFDVTEDGKAAEDRNLQAGRSSTAARADAFKEPPSRSAPTTTKKPRRRATTSACSRSSSTTITSALGASHVGPQRRSRSSSNTQIGPTRHGRHHVSARVDRVGPLDAQPRRRSCAGRAAVPRAQIRLHAAQSVRGESTPTTRPRSSRRSATRCRCRRSSR